MRTKSALLVLFMAVGLACADRHAERRPGPRGEPVVASRADWTKLGERWVEGTGDRDVISVGAREGSFRRIMIVVEHSALEMYDVDVTFADGTSFSPRTRHVFGPETRSHVIDLPGNQRVIRNVVFKYGNLPGGGRAQAELWAQ
jgi:hypothetical protein